MHPLHLTWRVRGIPAEADEAWLLNTLQNHDSFRLAQSHQSFLQTFKENPSLRILCTSPDILRVFQDQGGLLQAFQTHPYLVQIFHDHPDFLRALKTPPTWELFSTHPYLTDLIRDHPQLLQVLNNPPDIQILEENPNVLRLLHENPDLPEALKQHPRALPLLQKEPHLLEIANSTETNRGSNNNGAEIYTFASDLDGCKIATVRFRCLPEELYTRQRGGWLPIETSYDDLHPPKRKPGVVITIDSNFDGLTVLYSPLSQEHKIDILALSGLGSHPFGSFKSKDDGYMWLCDSLPRDLPGARIIIYGCNSTLQNSSNFARIDGYGNSFESSLTQLLPSPATRPLLLLGHSLGGLVIKQALIRIADSEPHRLQSIRGLLFFGVPNNGLNIESLVPMVKDQPNRPFLDSLGPNSESLSLQRQRFPGVLRKSKMEMFCFYETLQSPTAEENSTGRFTMTGPPTCLVNIPSATSCLPPDLASNMVAMQRAHSNLVKFKRQDPEYPAVLGCFKKILANLSNEEMEEYFNQPFNHMETSTLTVDERKMILESLEFDTMDSRHQTIRNAHVQTCKWFITKPEYRAWRNSKKPEEHKAILWIKGKPGAGKSTLMKFIVAKARSTMRNSTIIRFFFNARGKDKLEKSTEGMYRSILLQLLRKDPTLQSVFDSLGLVSSAIEKHQWKLESLETLFQEAVQQFQGSPIFCFVDALDECDEMQVRRMLSFFEQTRDVVNADDVKFHVCFSSRHYPHISISHGIELILEDEMGHDEDIRNYLQTELRIGHSDAAKEIRQETEKKASGIFMWVVLVVGILNQDYDSGGVDLKKRLCDIPKGLHDLFKDILVRDPKNKESLLLCIQWTLFAKRALTPEEFYFAIHSAAKMGDLEGDSEEIIKKFLLNSSKGLVELVKSKKQTVQFIHESVRDFFLKENGLEEIWPEVAVNFEGKSHERLKQCCLNEMNILSGKSPKRNDAHSKEESDRSSPSTNTESPFFQYAVENLFFHADAAQKYNISQQTFLEDLPLSDWITLKKKVAKARTVRYDKDASLLYILAVHDSANLIQVCPSNQDWLVMGSQPHGPPIIAALFYKSYGAVEALLQVQSKAYPSTSPLYDLWTQYSPKSSRRKQLNRAFNFSSHDGVLYTIAEHGDPVLAEYVFAAGNHDVNVEEGYTPPLHVAARCGNSDMIQWLLKKGSSVNASGVNGQTELIEAATYGQVTSVRVLLERGADLEAADRSGKTALINAVVGRDIYSPTKPGKTSTVRLLLEKGANIEARGNGGQTALMYSAEKNDGDITRLLLENGAGIEARDNSGQTALMCSTRNKNSGDTTQLLLNKGVKIEAADNDGRTALMYSTRSINRDITRFLLENGAGIEARDNGGQTALMYSANSSDGRDITQLLLDKGADIEVADNDGRTVLLYAIYFTNRVTAELLIERGANIEATDKNGETALIKAARWDSAMARILVEKGANIEATNKNGQTALAVATSRGNSTVARLLIEQKAKLEQQARMVEG